MSLHNILIIGMEFFLVSVALVLKACTFSVVRIAHLNPSIYMYLMGRILGAGSVVDNVHSGNEFTLHS